MLAPVVLLGFAIGLGAFAWVTQDSLPHLPIMELAVLLGVGALFLFIAAFWQRGAFWRPPAPGRAGGDVVLDGSNILHWAGEGVDPDSLRRVIGAVRKAGYHPVVWFDANAGYLVEGRYAGPLRLGKIFAMPAKDVFVAPKGEPADPHILAAARARGALIVTNDRYRDWADGAGQGLQARLVRGAVKGRTVTLEWPKGAGQKTQTRGRHKKAGMTR